MQRFGRLLLYAAAALVSFGAACVLGSYVIRFGEPGAVMAFARAIVGIHAHRAWDFTLIARPEVLAPLGIALILAAFVFRAWSGRIAFSLLSLLVSWRADAFLQHLFKRPRRTDWVIHHETSYSYPSSHAAISCGFYLLWAYFIARSELPKTLRIALTGLLVLLWPAILWSRLALGAHYPSDLLGGTFVGLAAIFALAAVVETIKVVGATSRRA
ncbi:MAG: phosphatase PAP2 family protein [Candidatus Eremiobacteraeota bacterium]|uniref:Phosphatidic acid phosphatase type 2/haloperoxidase domain-containing protein n=1 Tax=mine drainage metagenome TaxID=410659 RepID=E6PFR9_9ZZZZ|nr:phosphatase PAP2 family protein [Candidatus Eremiobacteraeota bacterium]